jgi:hypothetical protein
MQKTTFGLNSINTPTPKWATYLFRIVLYLSTLGSIAVSSLTVFDRLMSSEAKLDLIGVFGFVTLAVHLFTRAFGLQPIDQKDFEPNNKN